MKNLFLLCLLICLASILSAQNLEVEGSAKITVMNPATSSAQAVARETDGTLSLMPAGSSSGSSTTRTWKTDLLLASATACSGGSLPTGMVDSLINNGYTIQDLIDFGVTTSLIGLNHAGGIIFFVQGDGTGLVAAPSDLSSASEWGCSGTSIAGADGTAIGTGAQNTIDIVAGCATSGIAANLCADLSFNGFTDWFLPSREELIEMDTKIGQGATAPNTNIGNFAASFYWSSSENSANSAWTRFFGGNTSAVFKDNDLRVRPIRAF